MGVFPGFGGQKFIPYVMDKISAAKALVAGIKSVYVSLGLDYHKMNVQRQFATPPKSGYHRHPECDRSLSPM